MEVRRRSQVREKKLAKLLQIELLDIMDRYLESNPGSEMKLLKMILGF